MVVMASVSLVVLQVTEKLVVVTVLVVGLIWALALKARAVRTARTAAIRVIVPRMRNFFFSLTLAGHGETS